MSHRRAHLTFQERASLTIRGPTLRQLYPINENDQPFTVCDDCDPPQELNVSSLRRHSKSAKHLRAIAERDRRIAERREADKKKKRQDEAAREKEAKAAAKRKAEQEEGKHPFHLAIDRGHTEQTEVQVKKVRDDCMTAAEGLIKEHLSRFVKAAGIISWG